jgi:hypothetical protein
MNKNQILNLTRITIKVKNIEYRMNNHLQIRYLIIKEVKHF